MVELTYNMVGRIAGRTVEIAVLGDWNAICDRCGRRMKASEMRKDHRGLRVCPDDWDPWHPLDFYNMPKEGTGIPWSRTRSPDRSTTVTFSDTTAGDPSTISTLHGRPGIVSLTDNEDAFNSAFDSEEYC